MPRGASGKTFRTSFTSATSDNRPLPKVFAITDTQSTTPMQ
jgi:hypothetical protein